MVLNLISQKRQSKIRNDAFFKKKTEELSKRKPGGTQRSRRSMPFENFQSRSEEH